MLKSLWQAPFLESEDKDAELMGLVDEEKERLAGAP